MRLLITDLQCKEPWLYWWISLTIKEQRKLGEKYFPGHGLTPTREQREHIWTAEQIGPLTDDDWLELAAIALDNAYFPPPILRTEIWRQVYRIASQRK